MSIPIIHDAHLKPFIGDAEFSALWPEMKRCHDALESGAGAGADFLGWFRLPSGTSPDVLRVVREAAELVRDTADILVCVGIGGSYLGARAGIEFLRSTNPDGPEVAFVGHQIASGPLRELLDRLEDRRVCVNVISKSGTTTEPALAFRFIKEAVEKRHGRAEAARRIIVTTCPKGGALNHLAETEGYRKLAIPDDVGGRFSVLTPVGLLPMAVAGINIGDVLYGAREAESVLSRKGQENPAWRYAATREILRRKGKAIEIMAAFQSGMGYILEWWKQLAGESEGKQGRGLFPASAQYSTDLHSLGQWVQEGPRSIFETFLWIESGEAGLAVPRWESDADDLNYLAGKSLEEINRKAFEATTAAHRDGGVPNLTLNVPERSARSLGALFYFFQRVVALSGYLLGVNPFDQPGVESYKKNMFALLNKPGYGKGA